MNLQFLCVFSQDTVRFDGLHRRVGERDRQCGVKHVLGSLDDGAAQLPAGGGVRNERVPRRHLDCRVQRQAGH